MVCIVITAFTALFTTPLVLLTEGINQGCLLSRRKNSRVAILGPDFFQRERGHQLAVALDVGRRPDGRGVGGGRPASAAAPAAMAGCHYSVGLVAVPLGLGQLGQVDARPCKEKVGKLI